MDSYPISNLKNSEAYLDLAKDLLNASFNLNLESHLNRRTGANLRQVFTNGQFEVLAQVRRPQEILSYQLDKFVKDVKEEIFTSKPQRYILLYFDNVFTESFEQLKNSLIVQSLPNIDFKYYNLDWIENQLLKYPEIADKHKIRLNDKSYPRENDSFSDTDRVNFTELIKSNHKYLSDKYEDILQSNEFYFQKVRDVIEELKGYSQKFFWNDNTSISSFELLLVLWNRWGGDNPEEFDNYVQENREELVEQLRLVKSFVSYIYRENSFIELNNYHDKRTIYPERNRKVENISIEGFLVYASNNFVLNDKKIVSFLFNVINYIQNPQDILNISDSVTLTKVSNAILGTNDFLAGADIQNKLVSILDTCGFEPKNPENKTALYSAILYDPIVREKLTAEIDNIKPFERISDNHVEPNTFKNNNTETIPFHLDEVIDDDKLGREPIAKAFVDLIKKDVFTPTLQHSFIVHLQGEWGAGKSSFLRFIKKHLSAEEEKWIVVDYNAWQNQHVSPPWWTLIDQIYRKTKESKVLSRRSKFRLCIKENLRRIIRYRSWQKGITILLTLTFIVLLWSYDDEIYQFLSGATIDKTKSVKVLNDSIKFLLTIVGVAFSFSKFVTSSLFVSTPQEASSFVKRASDPMNRIKKHFEKLVDDINIPNKRQLAVFIDDIDRCNKGFIVELLEGIQTLFKEKRVLYIVSGDKKWITTSFGNVYEEFSNGEGNCNQLGELFLEKAFQLSFRMPVINEEVKKEYWDFILGINQGNETKEVESIEYLEEDVKREIEEVANEVEDIASEEFTKKLEKDFNLSPNAVSNYVIQEKNRKKDELKHLLKNFYKILDPNPRSIKRLANNYTMIRSTLIAERKFISPEKIFRWLVLEGLHSPIKNEIKKVQTIDDLKLYFKEQAKDKVTQEKYFNLLLDENDQIGGVLDIQEIKVIMGH